MNIIMNLINALPLFIITHALIHKLWLEILIVIVWEVVTSFMPVVGTILNFIVWVVGIPFVIIYCKLPLIIIYFIIFILKIVIGVIMYRHNKKDGE